jgi:Flp pilus assembly protein CpaB
MRRGRIFIFLALILVIGLAVVAFVARQFLLPGPTDVETQVTSVGVYIAGQSIPQGEKITEDSLSVIEIPQDKVVSVMFTTDQQGDLLGKVARYPLDQGVVITRSMISDGSIALSGPAWAASIPPGMTAVSLPVSRLSSVAYGVADGAHVNVTACFLFIDIDPSFQTSLPNRVVTLRTPAGTVPDEMPGITLGTGTGEGVTVQGRTEVEPSFQQGLYLIPTEEQRPRMVCQMLLQDVVVLKLGNFSLTAEQVQAEQAPPVESQQQAPPQIPDIVTLVVSPQDAITLSYLLYSEARLSLYLRNAADQSRLATEAATLQFLLSQYNIPVPVKLPYGIEPRVDRLVAPALKNDTAPPAE